jgi:hypothetical protein
MLWASETTGTIYEAHNMWCLISEAHNMRCPSVDVDFARVGKMSRRSVYHPVAVSDGWLINPVSAHARKTVGKNKMLMVYVSNKLTQEYRDKHPVWFEGCGSVRKDGRSWIWLDIEEVPGFSIKNWETLPWWRRDIHARTEVKSPPLSSIHAIFQNFVATGSSRPNRS